MAQAMAAVDDLLAEHAPRAGVGNFEALDAEFLALSIDASAFPDFTTTVQTSIQRGFNGWTQVPGFLGPRGRYDVTVEVSDDAGEAAIRTRWGLLSGLDLKRYAIFCASGSFSFDSGPELDVIGPVFVQGDAFVTKGGSPAWYHEGLAASGNFYAQHWDPTSRRTDTRSGDNVRIRTTNSTSNYTHAAPGAGNPVRRFNTSNGTASNSSQQLDSRIENWAPLASQRWGFYVRDQAHAVRPLDLPEPPGGTFRDYLARPEVSEPTAELERGKFARKASLYITGDPTVPASLMAYDGWNPETRNPVPLHTTHEGVPNTAWLRTARFYNGRERKTIHTIDVDLGVLGSAVANGDLSLGGGIIYATPDRARTTLGEADNLLPWYAGGNTYTQHAIRLVNAAQIPGNPDGALTIATDAPLYTRGDVNSMEWVMLLLAGDSINTLSNAFNDATYDPYNTANTGTWATNIRNETPENNWNANGGGREGPNIATTGATTLNAVVLGGQVTSQPSPHHNYGRYSGGIENWFRFIENWSGRNLVFNGSILSLFESQITTASWDSDSGAGTNSNYYGAPTRVWSWDTRLASDQNPPGVPEAWSLRWVTPERFKARLLEPISEVTSIYAPAAEIVVEIAAEFGATLGAPLTANSAGESFTLPQESLTYSEDLRVAVARYSFPPAGESWNARWNGGVELLYAAEAFEDFETSRSEQMELGVIPISIADPPVINSTMLSDFDMRGAPLDGYTNDPTVAVVVELDPAGPPADALELSQDLDFTAPVGYPLPPVPPLLFTLAGEDGPKVLHARAMGPGGVGEPVSGSIILDRVAPIAALVEGSASIEVGGSLQSFSIVVSDEMGIDADRLVGIEVTVSGPRGFEGTASIDSIEDTATPNQVLIVCGIVPPGGTWNFFDNGSYHVAINGGQTADFAGNSLGEGTVGTFEVDLPIDPNLPPGDFEIAPVLHVQVLNPAVDPEGGIVHYTYRWTSDGGDTPVERAASPALEDALRHGIDGVTLDSGETWIVTVTPVDEYGAEGTAKSVKFVLNPPEGPAMQSGVIVW